MTKTQFQNPRKDIMLPLLSLDQVTSTTEPAADGAVKDLEGVYRHHTLSVVADGAPTTCVVELQASQDGERFFILASLHDNIGQVTVNTHLVRYVKASLDTLEGGTSPTVNAWVTSA